jgi:hypothetical protein
MITVRLSESWSQRLVQMPESGMGYQRVDVLLKDGRLIKNVMVLNAEECQTSEPFDPADIADIALSRSMGKG